MIDQAFLRQLQGYGLTTAKILYRFPDYSSLLQEYVWQDYDLALLRLLLGRIGDDDAALCLLFRINAADDDAVVQGTKLHKHPLCRIRCCGLTGAAAGSLALTESEC